MLLYPYGFYPDVKNLPCLSCLWCFCANRFPSAAKTVTAVRKEDVLKFCFPDKEAIRPVRCDFPPS